MYLIGVFKREKTAFISKDLLQCRIKNLMPANEFLELKAVWSGRWGCIYGVAVLGFGLLAEKSRILGIRAKKE